MTEVPAPYPLPSQHRFRREDGMPPGFPRFAVSPLRLYVAIARSSMLSSHPIQTLLETSGAFFQYGARLSSNHIGVRLRGALNLKDSRRTEWASRVGDALGLLYMEATGHKWFAHFESVQVDLGSARLPSRVPDYIAARRQEAVLVECKGTTSSDERNFWSGRISHGYRRQIAPWLGSQLYGTCSIKSRIRRRLNDQRA